MFNPVYLVNEMVSVNVGAMTPTLGVQVLGSVTVLPNGSFQVSVQRQAEPDAEVGLIAHEVAHIRYKSFSVNQALEKYTKFWTDWAMLYRAIYEMLEDVRVEYHLMRDFPATLPFIAALRNLVNVQVKINNKNMSIGFAPELLRNIRTFTYFGRYEPEWKPLANFLSPRLTILARSAHPLDTVKLASQVLGYALLWRQPKVPKVKVDARGNAAVSAAITFEIDEKLADDIFGKMRRKKYGRKQRAKAKPDGSIELEEEDDNGLFDDDDDIHGPAVKIRVRKGKKAAGTEPDESPTKLPKRGKKDAKGAAKAQEKIAMTPWGGIQSDLKVVLDKMPLTGMSWTQHNDIVNRQAMMQRHFAEKERSERRRDIASIAEALKVLTKRGMQNAHEGEMNIHKQVEAYTESFLGPDDQGRVYRKPHQTPMEADVIFGVDISGSMSVLCDRAMSDCVALSTAFGMYPSARIAIYGVETDVHILKTFTDTWEDGYLYPRAWGDTNFHLFLERLPSVSEDWRAWNRLIVFVTDGYWPWTSVRWDALKKADFYKNVKMVPVVYEAKGREDALKCFGVAYKDIFEAVEKTVGMRVIR